MERIAGKCFFIGYCECIIPFSTERMMRTCQSQPSNNNYFDAMRAQSWLENKNVTINAILSTLGTRPHFSIFDFFQESENNVLGAQPHFSIIYIIRRAKTKIPDPSITFIILGSDRAVMIYCTYFIHTVHSVVVLCTLKVASILWIFVREKSGGIVPTKIIFQASCLKLRATLY